VNYNFSRITYHFFAKSERKHMPPTDRFLRACRRQAVDATPIWLMRQAGRYMAEYRALRERYAILELIKNPDLAAEVTLQPIKAFNLDAAIIFADILPPLQGMGLNLEFVKGDGPVIGNPLRSAAEVAALLVRPAEETLGFTLAAIRLVRAELEGGQLRHRRRLVAQLRRRQAHDVRPAPGLASVDEQAGRGGRRLSVRAGRRRGAGAATV
jgi:hypothetical protein